VAPITSDTFFNGRIIVAQPDRGYRYSIDAVLLASLPRPSSGASLLDLGTGCGIIPLILAYRHPGLRITGVEVQPELARLARMNVSTNSMQDRIRIMDHDLRHLSVGMIDGPADWIVSNPPYRRTASGRINPNSQRALARHEINLDLRQLIESVKRLLKTGGRFDIIYPSDRTVDLLSEMRRQMLEPKFLRCVHSHPDDAAKLVLVEAIMGGRSGLTIQTPLSIYGPDGQYSDAVREMMTP
jgi:tRNA1Val (adenine37-N6)-methyltransferase